jgi:Hint domain
MKTGFRGTFVISWSQTDVDGIDAAPKESLDVGAAWSWRGEAVRVDGPNDLLRLDQADGEADIRKRAARKVQRLIGAAIQNKTDIRSVRITEPLMDRCFVVTNGAQSYTVTIIDIVPGAQPLLMFVDELPPRNTDLWVVHHSPGIQAPPCADAAENGVICFTPGTRIATPDGPRPVEDLRIGDRVQTRDNGADEILWIGSRRMSGARLFAYPRLRPVRFRPGALGIERPDHELLVSPEHRMLVRGPVAQALFNTSEVLVAAKELVNGSTVSVDLALREVTYIHLLLPHHQILWANGVETESFHPANANLSTLSAADRQRLLAQIPDLERDPHNYGGFARRNLSVSESAILRYEAA